MDQFDMIIEYKDEEGGLERVSKLTNPELFQETFKRYRDLKNFRLITSLPTDEIVIYKSDAWQMKLPDHADLFPHRRNYRIGECHVYRFYRKNLKGIIEDAARFIHELNEKNVKSLDGINLEDYFDYSITEVIPQ